MAIPFILFYVVGKFISFFVAVYRYQYQGYRQTGSRGYGSGDSTGFEPGKNRTFHDPYEVLNCSRSSSDSDIKKNYRELIAKYHPDRFVGMSLDDDFVRLASEKFQEIQSAYDSIRRERGF